jgi:hypothetical protein
VTNHFPKQQTERRLHGGQRVGRESLLHHTAGSGGSLHGPTIFSLLTPLQRTGQVLKIVCRRGGAMLCHLRSPEQPAGERAPDAGINGAAHIQAEPLFPGFCFEE